MTARPEHPGISETRVQDAGASPEVVTADPDLALARWENEGGLPAPRSRPERGARPAAAVTERGNRFPGSITPGDDAVDGR